jgi:deazaflavin-dependent oxidoreductase (nitroreductase family)
VGDAQVAGPPAARALSAWLQYDPAIDALSLADRTWPLLRRVMGVHTQVYRLTGGLIGHRVLGSPPVLLLDHVGAKSGTKRTTPLVYVDDPPNVVIVASKGGHPRNPAWYHNLLAHPDTEVQIGSEHRRVRARVATAAERRRLWPMALRTYSGYEGYQQRTDREIPLVILEPRDGAASGDGTTF